jgi:PA domain
MLNYFYYTSKQVRNAQRAGAAAVIIADNSCLCNNTACVEENESLICERHEPILADDGSGADIGIPSFLLFKLDADAIKAELQANHPVQIELSWNLPRPDDRVEYDLWTTPSDMVSRDLLGSYKSVAEALGRHSHFTPHMYIYDGIIAGCRSFPEQNYCGTLCTNGQRYCSKDPDGDVNKGVSGAHVVHESLRRLCIWSSYGASNGVGTEWWDYVALFDERCAATAGTYNDDTCIQDVYTASGIESVHIENCMINSGGTEQDRPNALFDLELAARAKQGAVVIPSMFVNTAMIRGPLNVNNLFTAVCSAYFDGTTPESCLNCAGCSDPMSCIRNSICSPNMSSKKTADDVLSTSFFLSSMFTVVGFLSGLAIWHYKRTRHNMRVQVRDILAEYLPLNNDDDERYVSRKIVVSPIHTA